LPSGGVAKKLYNGNFGFGGEDAANYRGSFNTAEEGGKRGKRHSVCEKWAVGTQGGKEVVKGKKRGYRGFQTSGSQLCGSREDKGF